MKWLAATLLVVAIVYTPQLGTPFELQDDHRIVAPLVKPHTGALSMYAAELRNDMEKVGRFRPVNQIFDVIGPVVLGPRPLLWHVVSLLLALSVAALLFHVGKTAFASPAAGAMLALVTLLAPDPGPTATWYRLGPKEAWGMLFLAAALALIVARRNEVLTFVLVALAAYSKESFLLLVPAVVLLRGCEGIQRGPFCGEKRPSASPRLLRDVPASPRRRVSQLTSSHSQTGPPWIPSQPLSGLRRRSTLAYAALFAAGMLALLVAVKTAGAQSYGGQSLGMTPAGLLRVLIEDVLRAPALAVWFIPFLLALRYRRPAPTSVLIFLAWAGSQYALYATRGGFWDHYWLPCVVAFAAANAWGISVLRGKVRAVALLAFALWTINAMRVDITAVRNHREKARVQQEAVRIAAEHVRPEDDLVVVHDSATQSEIAPAFADFVRARGGRYRRLVLHDPKRGAIPDGAVVVHLRQPAPPRAGYERQDASGEREYLSLRQRGWVSIPFGLQVDVKKK